MGLGVSIIMASIAMGSVLWRLASKLSTLSTKLDAHIENTQEWRKIVLEMIRVEYKRKEG